MTLKSALCLFYSRHKKTVCTRLKQVGSAYTFYSNHEPVTPNRINPSFFHILACCKCRKKLLPLLVMLLYWNASITLPKPNDLITGWDLLTLYWKKSQPDTTVQPPSLSLSASMSSEQSFTKQHLEYEFILGATRASFTIQIRVGTEYDEKCPNANSCLLKHNRAIHSLGHVLMLHPVLNTNIEKTFALPAHWSNTYSSSVTESIEIFILYLCSDLSSAACLGLQLQVTSDITSTKSILDAKPMKQSQAWVFCI